jgi:hypothetical protein
METRKGYEKKQRKDEKERGWREGKRKESGKRERERK